MSQHNCLTRRECITLGDVAFPEPHISQLMEDLELLNREKEALAGEKHRVEQQYSQAALAAKQQQDAFEVSRLNLQKELKHLEIGAGFCRIPR